MTMHLQLTLAMHSKSPRFACTGQAWPCRRRVPPWQGDSTALSCMISRKSEEFSLPFVRYIVLFVRFILLLSDVATQCIHSCYGTWDLGRYKVCFHVGILVAIICNHRVSDVPITVIIHISVLC